MSSQIPEKDGLNPPQLSSMLTYDQIQRLQRIVTMKLDQQARQSKLSEEKPQDQTL